MNTIVMLGLSVGPASVVVPVLILLVCLGFAFVGHALAKRYKRIAPNVIGVVYGRKHRVTGPDGQPAEVGFKLVTGGSVFIMPLVQSYAEMSTEAFQIEIAEENIPTRKNVGVHVAGVATCRVSPIPEEQVNAVQNFLGKTQQEIVVMIREILRGHLRSIVGGLEIEELLRERAKFNERVVSECSAELSRMGIKILTLVIQDVKDNQGYIEALGKQAVATAKRDAEIAVAEAERDTTLKTSDAARVAAEVKAKNDAMIKEAEKNRDIQVAQFRLETAAKQAEADMAGNIAKTRQEQELVVLVASRDRAGAEAQVKVQEMEALRKAQELQATVIVQAEAEAQALSIRAEGKRKAETIDAETRQNVAERNAKTANLQAEGNKNASVQTALGEAEGIRIKAEANSQATRQIKTAEADGDKAILLAKAEGAKATQLADAEGERAKLLAQAEGQRQNLLAQAEGKKNALLAEADGTNALAEALQKLSEQGRLILILDRLPNLLDKGGDAGAKIAKEIFAPIGDAIGSIKSVNITDLGGGTAAKNGISSIGMLVPQLVTDFVVSMKARGVDPSALLGFLKLNPEGLFSMIEAGVKNGDVSAPQKTNGPVAPALEVPARS